MEIIRDPIWNNIRLDSLALELVDTPVFQRLRYVRQLGLAYLVYPGATHTRFEHALGAYHLCRIAIGLLRERGIADVPEEECTITTIAALLHDVGHYPFSHALEEIGATNHEEVATALVTTGPVASILRSRIGENAPERIIALIRGEADSPLQGLVSGSLDLDKIEYLKRDAHMCGVAYGEIDVDRLINSMVLVGDPVTGLQTVGVAEKGLSALESLLFAKYQMYRNVYWHHAVRSATAMYKRVVEDACESGTLTQEKLVSFTDEGLLYFLQDRAPSPLLAALRSRHLFKRVAEWPASELDDGFGDWIGNDRKRTRAAENALGSMLGLKSGELLLDYPEKTQMLGLDIAVLRRDATVETLTNRGISGAINLPRLSEELYRSARWLRVFTARRLEASADEIMRSIASS
ncbi:MAG TPA: HD domain-containing protein [Gemmatimonadaceae bacterium]|nr:HD domain-containing protein [Gemmatimonadaceae bacterium]